MSIPAPYEPYKDIQESQNTHHSTIQPRSDITSYFTGHIYSTYCTIPNSYIFWFSPPSSKQFTVTGESKSQMLELCKKAILQSNVQIACKIGVELHCSGYAKELLQMIIGCIGTHIHIHNPNIASRIAQRYRRFEKQLDIPKGSGSVELPTDEEFYKKPEIVLYNSNVNCQSVRNFIIESIVSVTLSHQKELTLPRINPKDITHHYLYKEAKKLEIGGKKVVTMIQNNELQVVLEIIQKYILYKTPKVEKILYWIVWLTKLEGKIKRKGEKLPCKAISVQGVPKKHRDHWFWYIWKSVFSRVSFCDRLKKKQIIDIYELSKIEFTKQSVSTKLPLLFFAIRLLTYHTTHYFPDMIHNAHLYIQAYSNNNTLYRNLQISLSRKSWIQVLGDRLNTTEDVIQRPNTKIRKPKKITKKLAKEIEQKRTLSTLSQKTAYLDIIPKAENYI